VHTTASEANTHPSALPTMALSIIQIQKEGMEELFHFQCEAFG
jgi:hypothetical protein